MPSTAAYLLVSTAAQSVGQQRDAIGGARIITPDKAFTDTASGSAGSARPGWIECLNWLREGETLVAVAVAVDQLGRSVGEVAQTMHQPAECAVSAHREGVDASRPASRATLFRELWRAGEVA